MWEDCLAAVNEKLRERNEKLLYLAISGSHAWGLQREDSDVDLRGVYQKPTNKILELHKGKDTIEYHDGPLDVQLYEVEKFLRMLCKHNGNMVSLLHSPLHLYKNSEHVSWHVLGKAFLTKKLRFYYRGYADSQRKRALSQRGGKALIYTYKEMFSGLYLMKYGKMNFNFLDLWRDAERNSWYIEGLLYKYYANPTLPISDVGWSRFYREWEELSGKLDTEAANSPLPDAFDGYELCNWYLKKLRFDSLNQIGGQNV